jgi:hypothetical protein
MFDKWQELTLRCWAKTSEIGWANLPPHYHWLRDWEYV